METNNPAAADRCKRAEQAVANNDFDRAIAAYIEAIRVDPNVADFYLNRGDCYFEKGEYGEAIADYSKVIWLDPKNAYAYSNRPRYCIATESCDVLTAELDGHFISP
jgi:tetratricopeptide (TPR) repeat protein